VRRESAGHTNFLSREGGLKVASRRSGRGRAGKEGWRAGSTGWLRPGKCAAGGAAPPKPLKKGKRGWSTAAQKTAATESEVG
jgi:hypothetical protein